MRTCKKCGAQFPDDNNFCSRCGEKYTEYVSPPEYHSQTTGSTFNSSSSETIMKYLPLGVGILGFIIAWESSMSLGLIACAAAAVYSYSRYNHTKSNFDKISLIVSAGAAVLVILFMLFL
jgi:Predicted membrane protein